MIITIDLFLAFSRLLRLLGALYFFPFINPNFRRPSLPFSFEAIHSSQFASTRAYNIILRDKCIAHRTRHGFLGHLKGCQFAFCVGSTPGLDSVRRSFET